MRRFAGTVTWRCGVTPEAIAAWTPPATGRRGRPARYSDVAIETGLMLRLAFGRPWRQTEGLLGSLMRLLGLDLEVPDHTTFSRRSADREVASALARTDGPVTVIIDSTGLKVFGTGEWHLEKHGGQAPAESQNGLRCRTRCLPGLPCQPERERPQEEAMP